MIGTAEEPSYWPSCAFSVETIDGIDAEADSRVASLSLPGFCGYQCTSANPIWPASAVITVWFQVCGLPALVTPSGQLPGAVSTTPTTIVGSTAFIAEM